MTLQEVKKFIEENKENTEVQSYLDSFKVTGEVSLESFKEKVESDPSFKSYMDSEKDKHLTKGIETFKENNLDKLVEEEIKTRNPEVDEKDLALEKLQRQMDKMEQEKIYGDLKNVALKQATEKGLPTDLIDFFVATDQETTLGNLGILEEAFNSKLETVVKERLKGEGYTPPKSSTDKKYTAEDLKKMTAEEINENWDKIEK